MTSLGIAAGFPGRAIQPERPDQTAFLSSAVFADGRLWLLSDSGELSSIVEGAEHRVTEPLPDPAHGLCLHDRKPTVVTCRREGCAEWVVRERDGGSWSIKATTAAANGEEVVALACEEPDITVLTTTRLVTPHDGHTTAVPLSEPFLMRGVSTTLQTRAELLVGRNVGEWGGGLRRIDRSSGKVATIERKDSDTLCGSPLDTNCDPVNGIAAVPWHPGCVAAAIGLVHIFPHGRIVEVCGNEVKRLYVEPYRLDGFDDNPAHDGAEPLATVPFFGLVRRGEALWAAGTDSVYRITANGVKKAAAFGEFKLIDGIRVNFDSPDFVLVLTQVNQRRSVGGAASMLVPR